MLLSKSFTTNSLYVSKIVIANGRTSINNSFFVFRIYLNVNFTQYTCCVMFNVSIPTETKKLTVKHSNF
eukprot:UN14080